MKTLEQFLKKVYPEPNTGCWLWCGAIHPSGHGSLNGGNHNGIFWAHRYSYFLHYREFDRTKLVCHKCDVPWCVNPEHLYLGTVSDNVQDLIRRGNPQYARGKKIHTAKLDPDKVRAIRAEYDSGCVSMCELGRRYGVTSTTISAVITRFRWAHVS